MLRAISDTMPKRGSLTERTVSAAREVLAGERRGLRAYLTFAGPAVIASIAYIDPGNFATNIQAGAKYGYGLLWVVLLANVISNMFQGLSNKLGIIPRKNLVYIMLGIVKAKNLAEMCRDHFTRSVVLAIIVVSENSIMATDLV